MINKILNKLGFFRKKSILQLGFNEILMKQLKYYHSIRLFDDKAKVYQLCKELNIELHKYLSFEKDFFDYVICVNFLEKRNDAINLIKESSMITKNAIFVIRKKTEENEIKNIFLKYYENVEIEKFENNFFIYCKRK